MKKRSHSCVLPGLSAPSPWTCRCGQKWNLVLVVLEGWRWFPVEDES